MQYVFKLPDVGEGIAEAEIVEYLVKPGDKVTADQPVIRIETDKAVVELPSPVSGTVVEMKFSPGDTVRVGDVILVIETEEKTAAEAPKERTEPLSPPPAAEKGKPSVPVKEEAGPPHPQSAKEPPKQILATPHTRKFARELNVDISTISGTGTHGHITDEDVRKAASQVEVPSPPSAAQVAPPPRFAPAGDALQATPSVAHDFDKYGPTRREPLKGVRKRTAEIMMRSVSTIPHVTHFDEADVTDLLEVIEKKRALADSRKVKLTLLAFLAKACSTALKLHPMLNASLDDETGELVFKDYYNIGFATDTEAGLMVPVVRNVDKKSIFQIGGDLQELSKKARERSIELDDMRGGTFTITNVGSLGGKWATPIIVPPQVAILCSLRAEARPIVKDGLVVVRTILPLTLSFDHRVLDGADAARFMNFLVGMLEDPMRMLMDIS